MEINLALIGYYSISSSRAPQVDEKVVHLTRTIDGQRRTSVARILRALRHRLPNTGDQDRLLAILRHEKVRGRWPPRRPIEFSHADICRELGHCLRSGEHHAALRESLDVMAMTTIVTEQAIYLPRERRFLTDTVRLFDRVVTVGRSLDNGRPAARNYVWLSEWLLENLSASHFLSIDFERYRSLRRPTARALVPLLHLWLYAAGDGVFEKRCQPLRELLGLQAYAHLSKLREKLGPAFDELRDAGYIRDWRIEPTKDGTDHKIVLRSRTRPAAVPSLRTVTPSSSPADQGLPAASAHIIEALQARGVNPRTAAALVERTHDPARVEAHIAWFDQLLHSPAGRAIRNPAGFLYRAIESNAPVPDLRAEPAMVPSPLDLEIAARRRLLSAYEQYVRTHVHGYIEALPADERAARLKAIEPDLLREHPSLRNCVAGALDGPARVRLEQLVRNELPLKSLAEFAREHADAATGAEAVS